MRGGFLGIFDFKLQKETVLKTEQISDTKDRGGLKLFH